MKKYIFLSHPYANNPTENKKKVDKICKYLIKHDIVPISPLHLFSFYDEDADREYIMKACFHMIDMCDEVWIYGDSEGCMEEMNYALSKGKKVVLMYKAVK